MDQTYIKKKPFIKNLDQLLFGFPIISSYGVQDFLVDSSNEAAHKILSSEELRPPHGLVIWGKPRVGKTHLSHVFQRTAKAIFLTEDDLMQIRKGQDITVPHKTFIVDSLEDVVPSYQNELFHLYNVLREKGGFLLITSQKSPGEWEIPLKDLESRLKTFLAIEVQTPSDSLLEAILTKKCTDLQIAAEPKVISYILTHGERSPDALQKLLEDLDYFAFSQGQKITIPLIKTFMDQQLAEREGFEPSIRD